MIRQMQMIVFMVSVIAPARGAVKGVSNAQVRYVAILAKASLFCHDCAYLEQPESAGSNAVSSGLFPPEQSGKPFSGKDPRMKQPDLGKHYRRV